MRKFTRFSSAGKPSSPQPTASSRWAAGALLRATVVDTAVPGRVVLRIGSHAVEVRTTMPLRDGETLSLGVSHSGALTVLEKVAAAPTAPRASGADSPNVRVSNATRDAVPRQQSHTGLSWITSISSPSIGR